MVSENWKPVIGFTGYEVSDLGNVRSYRSCNGRGPLSTVPRTLKLSLMKGKPYLRVGLTTDEAKLLGRPVHILVLEAFHGPRPEGLDSLHKDGNARNNVEGNLRWGTVQENADDRIKHGTQIRGTQVSLAVLTEQQVAEIKANIPTWKKGDGKRFSEKFNVGRSAVSAIKNGQTWRHV